MSTAELENPAPETAAATSKPWTRFLPILVFLVALLIRIPGMGWGLKNDLHNHSYHPDELVLWSYSQEIDPAKFDFTPGFYNYGTLYLTVLRVATDMTSAYTGAPDPKDANSVWSFVSRAHMAGRGLSALAGAGTVLVLFLFLRRRIGDFGAVMGALFIAVAPAHVMHSRFQTVDVVATFFLALSALFALRLLDRDRDTSFLRDAVLSGVFAGLSAGTKYTGVIAILTLFAVLAVRPKHRVREGLAGFGSMVLAFLVVTPGALLETATFRKDFLYEMAHVAKGHGLVFAGTGNGFLYHGTNLLYGIGAILTLLGLIGLGYFAFKKQVWMVALLSFFLTYFILIGRAEVKYVRYTFPLYIGLAAGFGALMAEGNRRGGLGRVLVMAGILGLGGADSRGLNGTAQMTVQMTGEDPRDQAVRWLRQNTSPGNTVGLAEDPWFWNPPLSPHGTGMRVGAPQREAWLNMLRDTSNPPVAFAEDPGGGILPFNPALLDQAPEYVTFSSLESDPRERLIGRTDVPADVQSEAARYRDFMKKLSEGYASPPTLFGSQSRLVEDMQYTNPVVIIWKRKG
jgi:hypothetical protein